MTSHVQTYTNGFPFLEFCSLAIYHPFRINLHLFEQEKFTSGLAGHPFRKIVNLMGFKNILF